MSSLRSTRQTFNESNLEPLECLVESKRVLIVCEGEKLRSEHLYLSLYKQKFKLESFDIEIVPCGKKSDFYHITQKVLECINKNRGNPYTHVFCVADVDDDKDEKNKKVNIEIGRLKKKCGKQEVRAIISNPCFEYWILLHLYYTTAEFKDDEALKKEIDIYLSNLKIEMEYAKNNQKFYRMIIDSYEIALKNAKQVQKYHKDGGKNENYPNPSTQFGELIGFLNNKIARS
ncbi:RloB family protein [Helicobacter cetorum]|uniref:Csm2 family CRISPR-associated protein n=1 Tax=Helicobacter cetorum (strain ATCC BAA-540 / CCUG 52418 / MIT 99-5656) TaxID=1163745 RepID=I0ERJ2_HELCM|nr:RloB family protein [Helicobacter cetorum]AFI05561.1 Csm2 family CRISPR-associated protein [Helicobacter cetorum MIT 99-5656]